MLAPKRAKFRKSFRGTNTGVAIRGSNVDFGEFGLKAMSNGWVTSRQIEAARRTLTHYTKRGGRIWIRIFPFKPVTKKGSEVGMGGGKGQGLAGKVESPLRPPPARGGDEAAQRGAGDLLGDPPVKRVICRPLGDLPQRRLQALDLGEQPGNVGTVMPPAWTERGQRVSRAPRLDRGQAGGAVVSDCA